MGKEKEGDGPADGDVDMAMEAFFKQFGDIDDHASIVLEEFFKELMRGEK